MYNAKYRELYHIIQDLEINGNKMVYKRADVTQQFPKML
ncbi:hypothetical protein OTSGILL_1369 [Orientia tsutsugamushi str. Gilliam]|uniref:Uncharacterized protein n=1 Tax=Orientia tsutsugamushi str. Gilliam TaxID=1359184 RepID=A0A0F3MA86_ORITS|nr:hypothetical protein OTSGILL_1369 [Orientia tsutsugamushi str. Gilliam]